MATATKKSKRQSDPEIVEIIVTIVRTPLTPAREAAKQEAIHAILAAILPRTDRD